MKYALIRRLNRVFIGTLYMAILTTTTHAHKLLLLYLVNQGCVLYRNQEETHLVLQHLRLHLDTHARNKHQYEHFQRRMTKNSLNPFWETLQYFKDLF